MGPVAGPQQLKNLRPTGRYYCIQGSDPPRKKDSLYLAGETTFRIGTYEENEKDN